MCWAAQESSCQAPNKAENMQGRGHREGAARTPGAPRDAQGGMAGVSVQGLELDSMTLVSLFQLRIFCNSVLPFPHCNASAAEQNSSTCRETENVFILGLIDEHR